jgi:hypothetical protein
VNGRATGRLRNRSRDHRRIASDRPGRHLQCARRARNEQLGAHRDVARVRDSVRLHEVRGVDAVGAGDPVDGLAALHDVNDPRQRGLVVLLGGSERERRRPERDLRRRAGRERERRDHR